MTVPILGYIYNKLLKEFGVDPNTDYMLKLKKVINAKKVELNDFMDNLQEKINFLFTEICNNCMDKHKGFGKKPCMDCKVIDITITNYKKQIELKPDLSNDYFQ